MKMCITIKATQFRGAPHVAAGNSKLATTLDAPSTCLYLHSLFDDTFNISGYIAMV
jgi:hypothetical protein